MYTDEALACEATRPQTAIPRRPHRRGLQGAPIALPARKASHPGRVRHLVVMRERPHYRSRQTLGIIPCPRSQGSSISDEKPPIPDRHPDPDVGHPPAVGRRLALWRSRKPLAPRQCRGDGAAATPGPGADSAADHYDLAHPNRHACTDGRTVVHPLFDGANRRRDACAIRPSHPLLRPVLQPRARLRARPRRPCLPYHRCPPGRRPHPHSPTPILPHPHTHPYRHPPPCRPPSASPA